VNEALPSSNYVKQAQIVLEQWKESGIITKTYLRTCENGRGMEHSMKHIMNAVEVETV
jgi:hypothetical protein